MPDLYDTTLTVPLSVAATLVTDRPTGHRMTMQLWGDIDPTPRKGARAVVGCLWTVADIDPTVPAATVLVRSRTAPTRTAEWATTQTTALTDIPEPGTTTDYRVTLAAMHTPLSDTLPEWRSQLKAGADGTPRAPGQGLAYRSKQVPVPTRNLGPWALAKLERLGLDGTPTITPAAAIWLKGATIATAHLHVRAATAGEPLTALLRHGIGKARSYGLGLVLLG